ncbi:MAG TPA: hypothetical protein VFG11_03980 [Acidobacteriota bacterium]|nr:hypothetical protein [Acidobacteriota bacterium]
MRRTLIAFLLLLVFVPFQGWCAAPKFYDDDPVWVEPSTQDASGAKPWEIDLFYDFLENMFSHPGDPAVNLRAKNVNTVDEVPDSAWFTNRAGMKPLTAEDVAKGPDQTKGPADGIWTVIRAKNDGVTPGFTIKDTNGVVWFIKFDPPGYPAMATGSEVVVTNLLWALGYNVPENHISRLIPKNLVIAPGTKITPPSGKKRQMKLSDISTLLRKADEEKDGTYRVIASKALEGGVLGGFRFYGTRLDDPNDLIPHEHRRELRGDVVFAAWFDHVDCKAINSLDTLVKENGKIVVRHNLLDFGSALGSGGLYPRDYWEGYEYLYEGPPAIGKDLIAFGFKVEPWRTLKMYESKSIGRLPLDNTKWDPEKWVPRIPNPAFLRARPDDKFWAAEKATAITDDMIRAAVKQGQFNDPKSEEFLVKALIDRRDAILRAYLPAINPVTSPSLDASGTLTFTNAAVKAGVAQKAQSYQAVWYRFDNATGASTNIGTTTAATESISAPAGISGDFIRVDISAVSAQHPTWNRPVQAYFRSDNGGWKLVGFERMP